MITALESRSIFPEVRRSSTACRNGSIPEPVRADTATVTGRNTGRGSVSESFAEPAEKGEREIERASFCGSCGEPIGEDDEECPSCGVDLCPDCGSPLDPGETVCPECGTEFVFTCPECGEELGLDEDVCPHCGFEFGEEEENPNDE